MRRSTFASPVAEKDVAALRWFGSPEVMHRTDTTVRPRQQKPLPPGPEARSATWASPESPPLRIPLPIAADLEQICLREFVAFAVGRSEFMLKDRQQRFGGSQRCAVGQAKSVLQAGGVLPRQYELR